MQLGTDTIVTASADPITPLPNRPRTARNVEFFGTDGLTWHDALDAINPLEHIPIISELFDSATDSTPCTASRLVGGALLGGPIGFLASLASVIFESATGHGPAGAVVAALTGDDGTSTTQLAENTASPLPANETAQAVPVEAVTVSDAVAVARHSAPQQFASAVAVAPPMNKAVLDLYGASASSAHQSYQKAQMLPYLRDVTTSRVL